MSSIKTIKKPDEVIITKFGRQHGRKKPGLRIIWKWVMRVAKEINLQVHALSIFADKPEIDFADGISAKIQNCQIHVKVKEDRVEESFYEYEDYETQLKAFAQNQLRGAFGDKKAQEVKSNKKSWATWMADALDEIRRAFPFLEILYVTIEDFEWPRDFIQKLQQVMAAGIDIDVKKLGLEIAKLDAKILQESSGDIIDAMIEKYKQRGLKLEDAALLAYQAWEHATSLKAGVLNHQKFDFRGGSFDAAAASYALNALSGLGSKIAAGATGSGPSQQPTQPPQVPTSGAVATPQQQANIDRALRLARQRAGRT
ncbi:MAG: SPFH domain-containing protein [Candidatus Pacebacteria bacterium]|nr:SPFH domain-containing protein [Candidatus Paceibacterota bacterium]